MSTPNLDAMGHKWVGALVQFNFELEYQKGHDNTVADVLSWVTTWLDPDTVISILNGVTLGTAHQAKVHNPAIVGGNHHLEQEVCVAAGHALVQMHFTDWAEAQKEDPMFSHSVGLAEGTEDRFEGTSGRTQNMPPVKKAGWSYGIGQILWFIKEPCTCTQYPKVRLKNFYSLWSPGPIMLPPWTGATGMWVIRDVTIPCLCYRSVSGGQVWPIKCNSLSSPAQAACSMREICPKCPYTNCGYCSDVPLACRFY